MCKVRCAECGFLAVKRKEQLVEADEDYRIRGSMPSGIVPARGDEKSHECPAVCFVRAVRLSEEPGSYLDVIRRDRKCAQYTTWHLGFSPKEHIEMTLVQQQRQFELRQRKLELRWRDRQAKRDRKWRNEDIKRQERSHRNQLMISILAAIISGGLSGIGVWLLTNWLN